MLEKIRGLEKERDAVLIEHKGYKATIKDLEVRNRIVSAANQRFADIDRELEQMTTFRDTAISKAVKDRQRIHDMETEIKLLKDLI